jgi:hypothetical protein
MRTRRASERLILIMKFSGCCFSPFIGGSVPGPSPQYIGERNSKCVTLRDGFTQEDGSGACVPKATADLRIRL